MEPEIVEDRLAGQNWVETGDKVLSAVVQGTLARWGVTVRNFLHGVWLGHPLHPVVTDVPIGAFTVAAALDVLDAVQGTDKYEAGADAAVGIGLLSASFAAVTGLADWSQSNGEARRVGVLHAALNGGATLAYAASYWLRKKDEREAGVVTGLVGYALLGAGAFLGGNMVYNHKLGVDSTIRTGPEEFTPALPERELPEDAPHRADVGEGRILLVKQKGRVCAIGEKCSHLGGPLAEGTIEDGAVVCPWHQSKFSLHDGQVLEGPATYPQTQFETRVRAGQVEVRLQKRN